MILLKEIQLHNFLSHENTKLQLEPSQKLLIDGKSGSGKSSIVEALVWALYGRGRSDNRSLIKRGSKSARVSVILSSDDGLYKVIRSITENGKHEFQILKGPDTDHLVPVQATGIRGVQEYLEKDILHSSYLLFVNSIVFLQDNIESFVKQTASKRKEIILEMINADSYDEHYEKVKTELVELEVKQNSNTFLIDDLEERTNTNEEKVKMLPKLEEGLAKVQQEKEELEKIVSKQTVIKMEAGLLGRELVDIKNNKKKQQDTIKELSNKIKKTTEELGTFDIKLFEQGQKELEELKEKRVAYDKWKIQADALALRRPEPIDKYEVETIKEDFRETKEKKIDVCPEINKKCPVAMEQNQKKIALMQEFLQEIKKREQQISKYKLEVIKLKDKEPPACEYSNEEIENLTKERKQAEQRMLSHVKLEADIKHYKEELNRVKGLLETVDEEILETEKKYKEVKAKILEHDSLQMKKRVLDGRERDMIVHISNVENAKKEITESRKKMKEFIEANVKIAQDTDSLELLKDAFGPNGLKAMIIDYTLPRLEDKINEILSELRDFRIRLDTQRESVAGDKVIEGLFITITNELGEELDFGNFSGGERIKINTAIFEGLASIQKCNFRIFDETIVALDNETIEGFSEVLLAMKENISQVLCISHIDSIKELFEDRIEVKKIKGSSII